MAGHPIFVEQPSRDMTEPAERQRELDALIETFLAKGGEIQAFDPQRRPIEPTPWSAFQISPKRARTQPVQRKPAPAQAAATRPAVVAKPVPAPVVTQPAAVLDSAVPMEERVIAKIPTPARSSSDVEQSLRDICKQVAAIQRRLDRSSHTSRAT